MANLLTSFVLILNFPKLKAAAAALISDNCKDKTRFLLSKEISAFYEKLMNVLGLSNNTKLK